MTQFPLHSYDTSYFIRVALINEKIFNTIIKELNNINSNCIILRSVEQELIGPIGHLYNIDAQLLKFNSEIRKHSFETIMKSKYFMDFKKRYQIIAEHIEANKQPTELIDKIIGRIQMLSLGLGKGPMFPSMPDDYGKIINDKKYQSYAKRIKSNDAKHFALLELYGHQRKSGRIAFISCDKRDIVGKLRAFEIKLKYKYVEPVTDREWNKRFV